MNPRRISEIFFGETYGGPAHQTARSLLLRLPHGREYAQALIERLATGDVGGRKTNADRIAHRHQGHCTSSGAGHTGLKPVCGFLHFSKCALQVLRKYAGLPAMPGRAVVLRIEPP